jgi:tripartite ATP-independent transporter DctM subunit
MSHELIGAFGMGVLLVLMFLGLPIWLCMILVGSIGYSLVGGNEFLAMTARVAISTVRDYAFAVLPVFLLMGEFADISGMMKDAYASALVWLGKIRGGLAMASVFGAAAFSLLSGSSMACSAIMTRVALPRLLEHEYDPALATGALCAGGTLGNLIPPGVLLVVYAVMTDVSLGKLFVACYIPGFLLASMYMAQIYFQCKLSPRLAPGLVSSTWKEKLFATKGMAGVAIVLVLTLGGIQFGVFTPNEAASVSTVFVFLLALVKKTVNGPNLLQAFKNTANTTGMALGILIGAQMLNVFVALSQLPQLLAAWLSALNLSQLGVIILIMVVYFVMGIPMNGITILLVTLPILLPVLNAYRIDLIWFGVLAIVQCELANLTPPVGMNLFVVAAMAKPYGISMGTVFRGSIPFCATCILFLVLLIAFPQISTFLVTHMTK